MPKTEARPKTPSPSTTKPIVGVVKDPGSAFMAAALTMSWQLVIVMLVPVIGGSQLDKAAGTNHLYTFIGLALAIIGSAVVIWRTVQIVNRVPVPKLSAAERRKIQKRYQEEDD